MATRVRLDRAGMRALLSDPGVADYLEEQMQPVLDAAYDSAPVDTGAYRDSLSVEVAQQPSRVVARVVADVDHALAVEAAHGTLSRALDAAGG